MPRFLIASLLFFLTLWSHSASAQNYDGDGKLKKAEGLLEKNQNEEARTLLLSVVDKNSDNSRANILLGKSYLAENDYDNAIYYFNIASDHEDSPSAKNLILFAQAAKQSGNYQLAINYINQARKLSRLNAAEKKQIDNISIGINEVKNGSMKEYVNEISQFSKNTSGSEIAPAPIDNKAFNFSRSSKSEADLAIESFVSVDGNEQKIEVNPIYGNVTNVFFYGENAYLSICKDQKCKLYSALFNKNYRLKNIVELNELNLDGFSSTQAFIFKLRNTDMMLFASNRPSEFGGYDIYISYKMANGWAPPRLLDKTINTPGDEITPSYYGNQFYFSSNFHPNFGGFDIFSTTTTSFLDFQNFENLGTPFNSVANDLYFKIFPDGKKGLLSSNRVGSIEGTSATCCNDIYQFPWPAKRIESKKGKGQTSNAQATRNEAYYNSIISELQAILPLTLYFHNDIPLPKQAVPTYSQTYFPYRRMESEYLRENYSASNTDFFNNTLPYEYSKLQVFTSLIQEVFKSDLKIKFTIKGYASPLASKRYNDALSERRIKSFTNELFAFKSGIFEAYRNNISITQLPFGETQSADGVSDNKQDPKNSVYAFEALRERKIEILNISIKNESDEIEVATEKNNTSEAYGRPKIDSVLVKTESESSYVITDSGFRLDTVVVSNPYEQVFSISNIQASCGCTQVEATNSEIQPGESIKIFAKRELFNGSVKPVTLRFISTHPEEQASFVIPLD